LHRDELGRMVAQVGSVRGARARGAAIARETAVAAAT
jgi:hypothetical protein